MGTSTDYNLYQLKSCEVNKYCGWQYKYNIRLMMRLHPFVEKLIDTSEHYASTYII